MVLLLLCDIKGLLYINVTNKKGRCICCENVFVDSTICHSWRHEHDIW